VLVLTGKFGSDKGSAARAASASSLEDRGARPI
jgi:hypothetical protein